MSYANHIIDQFGGYRNLAKEIGQPISTVKSWHERGNIPDWHKWEVLEAARRRDLPITKSDFFPTEPTQ